MSDTVRTRKQNLALILTLGILNALTPFTIDMYLPAFPQIAQDLNVEVARMALTVSVYFIGFALGQILYGPFLDRFGRKPPLYAGIGLYLAATVGCMTTHSFEGLLFFRFISALGGCAASVGATAMVRDYFPPEDAPRIFSYMMLVLSASPLLAPTVGSLVVSAVGWRTIFGMLAALAVIDLILVKTSLPPGYLANPNVQLKIGPIARQFREIFRNPQFSTYTVAGSLSFAGLFVYIAGSPAIFMDGFGLTAKQFGVVFALLVFGMLGGNQINLQLLKRYDGKTVFRWAIVAQCLVASLFLAGVLSESLNLYTTVAMIFLVLTCCGISYPNAAAQSLQPFTSNVGSAAALLGFIQLGGGSVVSMGVGLSGAKGTLPTAAAMCASATLALVWLVYKSARN